MLNIKYTKEGLKNLKYVIVRVSLRNGENSTNIETRGLFFGYRTLMSTADTKPVESDELFLWLYKNRCIYLYNLSHFNIETIEVAVSKNGKTTQLTSYTEDGAKQKEAIKRIKLIKEALKDQEKIKSNGLVNISAYDSLPALFKDDVEEPASAKSTTIIGGANVQTAPAGATGRRTPSYSASPGHSAYTPAPRKTIETSVIKRTSRYPVRDAITKMKEKIDEIRNDTYSPPKLRKIPADAEKKAADDEKEGDITNVQRQAGFMPGTVGDEGDEYGCGYMGMC